MHKQGILSVDERLALSNSSKQTEMMHTKQSGRVHLHLHIESSPTLYSLVCQAVILLTSHL